LPKWEKKGLANNVLGAAKLNSQGLIRAKSFSWEKTAAKTLEVYKKVYQLPPSI
jgi:hypothetical protein